MPPRCRPRRCPATSGCRDEAKLSHHILNTEGLPSRCPPRHGEVSWGGRGVAPAQAAKPPPPALVQGGLCRQGRPCLPGLQLLSTAFIARKTTFQCPADGNANLPHGGGGARRLAGARGQGALLWAGSPGRRDAPAAPSTAWTSSSHTANSISHRYHDFTRQRGSTAIRGIGSGGRRS